MLTKILCSVDVRSQRAFSPGAATTSNESSPGRRGLWLPACCMMMMAACSGITEPVETDVRESPDIRMYLSGSAASALGVDGLFPAVQGTSPNGETLISATRARELAAAYIKSVLPTIEQDVEALHGKDINPAALTLARRVDFAQTPYGLFPDEGFHPAMPRLYGPFYLIAVNSGSEVIIVLGVSALATDYGVDPSGGLVLPQLGGNAFKPQILKTGERDFTPLAPEQAVDVVARATGARIESVPILHSPARPFTPALARWRIEVDRNVRVVVPATGRTATVRTVYVSPDRSNRLQIPAVSQPTVLEAQGTKVSPTFENLGEFPFVLAIRSDWPVQFETVKIVGSP